MALFILNLHNPQQDKCNLCIVWYTMWYETVSASMLLSFLSAVSWQHFSLFSVFVLVSFSAPFRFLTLLYFDTLPGSGSAWHSYCMLCHMLNTVSADAALHSISTTKSSTFVDNLSLFMYCSSSVCILFFFLCQTLYYCLLDCLAWLSSIIRFLCIVPMIIPVCLRLL